ncbi:hypothetical protein Tco_1136803 [Tanacetum coccineum]
MVYSYQLNTAYRSSDTVTEDLIFAFDFRISEFSSSRAYPTDYLSSVSGAIPSKTAADAKVTIQEMAEYSQKWHNGTSKTRSTKTSDGLAAI